MTITTRAAKGSELTWVELDANFTQLDAASGKRPGFDIVLCAGQSNMNGRSTLDASVDVAHSSVWQFGSYSGSGYYRKIIQGVDPLHMPDAINTGRVGPAAWFAKAYTRLTGRDVLLIPFAVGGTTLVAGTPRWSPSAPGDLYSGAIAQANLAITAALALYPDSAFVGSLWFQGESDGDSAVSQSTYAAALTALIAGFRTGITGAASSWFVMAQMVPEAISTRSGYTAIDLGHKQVRDNVAGTTLALTGDLTGNSSDNLHFNTNNGIRIVGARMALAVSVAKANTGVPSPPSQVLGVTVGGITQSSVALSWSVPVAGGVAVDYVVEYKQTSSGTWLIFADGTSTTPSTTVIGLTASTAYDFRISATNASGSGPVSSTVSATTSAALAAPGQVTGLTAGTPGSTSMPLTWVAPATGGAVADYMVEYKQTSSGTWLTFTDGVGSTLGATVTGLTASTGYDFRVTATNATGNGTPSSTVSASTSSGLAVPGQVTGLTAGTPTSGTVPLSWTAPGSGGAPSDYVVEYKQTSSGTWLTFTDGVSTTLSATVTSLLAATAYDFRVTALNATGSGVASSVVSATTSVSPTNLYNFEADTVGAAPSGIIVDHTGGTPTTPVVVSSGMPAGMSGKAMSSTSDGTTSNLAYSFAGFADSINQRLTWKRGQTASTRDGFTLRAHSPKASAAAYSNLSQGYFFQTSGGTASLRIFKVNAAVLTQVGTTVAFTHPAICHFRASVIGSVLTFEYSTDDMATWTVSHSVTDTTYAVPGGIQYVAGFDYGNFNALFIDDVAYEALP